MNFLFVNPTFRKWGGVEEVVVMLADQFRRQGHRIILASEDSPATLQGRFPPQDVHYALPLKSRSPLVAARNLIGLSRIVRRDRVDLISSHQKKSSVLCAPVARLLGVPFVHSAHNQMGGWLARRVGMFGRNVIANSQTTKDYLTTHFGVPREDITVIYDAVRLLAPPAAADVDRVRREFGIPPGQPMLVCLSRLSNEKGHGVLLRALPRVRERFPAVRLLIIGKGHMRRELEALAHELQLGDAVTFTGYRDDARAIVACGTVAVHPALWDAFPLTNLEYMAMGIPVVATAVQGVPEAVRHEDTGLLVEPNDPDALAATICRVLEEPEATAARVKRAAAFVRENFDARVMCARYEQYFNALLDRAATGKGDRVLR